MSDRVVADAAAAGVPGAGGDQGTGSADRETEGTADEIVGTAVVAAVDDKGGACGSVVAETDEVVLAVGDTVGVGVDVRDEGVEVRDGGVEVPVCGGPKTVPGG